MGYDQQRVNTPRTNTTRHLDADGIDDDDVEHTLSYFLGARQRSARFAKTTAHLREMRSEIDSLGRESYDRPTGVLSGGDVDIAYHYLGVGVGILATVYSVMGTIFALRGGSNVVLASFLQHWTSGPATALTDALLNIPTLVAVVLQAVLFVIIVGTRRSPQSWQHWAALMGSAALTYAGWSGLLLAHATQPLTIFTATIPAALIGGALAWGVVRATSDGVIPRRLMVGIIVAGVVAGALGVTTLIHWVGLLLAWSADQLARRMMVIG